MKTKKGPGPFLLNVLVTAGPTCEPIDPVRFISNYSTGFFGYEIAREARRRGHRVILISGPTLLAKPQGVRAIDVFTAHQMKEELRDKFSWCDCLIMTAAVCDFGVKRVAKKKIKRKEGGIVLDLKQNPDILGGLGRKKGARVLVGFALETENLKKNAQDKLRQKNLDLIVATQMKTATPPFGQVKIDALIVDRKGRIEKIKRAPKKHLSRILLERIEMAAYPSGLRGRSAKPLCIGSNPIAASRI